MKTLMLCLLGAISLASAVEERSLVLRFDRPAEGWENQGLPIGNGALGAVLMGGVSRAEMQFNVDSLWTGDENPSGSYALRQQDRPDTFGTYQNFGSVIFRQSLGEATITVSSPNDAEAKGNPKQRV
ncbi:MAG: glycoside hydrolase N-terminal domain-containing protein, partial [Verrucomicrobiales bacterium]